MIASYLLFSVGEKFRQGTARLALSLLLVCDLGWKTQRLVVE